MIRLRSLDYFQVAENMYLRNLVGSAYFEVLNLIVPQEGMAWLMRIARNLSLMRMREAKRTVSMSPEDWMEAFADRPDFSHEDAEALSVLLDTLSDGDREIVALHALTGLKHREIAVIWIWLCRPYSAGITEP